MKVKDSNQFLFEDVPQRRDDLTRRREERLDAQQTPKLEVGVLVTLLLLHLQHTRDVTHVRCEGETRDPPADMFASQVHR